MKHIINYLGALLTVVLVGTSFSACTDDDNGSANVGLGIKTFFPTKVVANQPMTINGSGFNSATEIEFPGGQKVTTFEVVSDNMIRVDAPTGIAADGGKLIVRTPDGEAESRIDLTLGHTNVTGFSKQPGETATGGDKITIFGTDLEFINSVELLDADSVPQIIDHKDFYRKGTSNVIFTVPAKNIYEGTWVGKIHTYDGQEFLMPELAYEPASDGGHWETKETIIWENPDPDGIGETGWGGTYRFAPESNSTGEEIYTVPQDIWDKMKTSTFYMTFRGSDWIDMKITDGWWTSDWTGANIQSGDERFVDNGDGTYTIAINFEGDPILNVIDAQHLLFTGGGYTPLKLFFSEEEWVGGGGTEIVRTSIWKNDGSHGDVGWGGTYRFAPESNSTGEEIYTVPQDIWDKMKTSTFYLHFQGSDWIDMKITDGWWTTDWTGANIQSGDERFVDNGDGTYTLAINFEGDPILNVIDAQHLLFTGGGYTPLELYFEEEITTGSGGDTPSEYDIAAFTVYEDQSSNITWPYYPSWSDNSGKIRMMRGMGDPAIEAMGLTTSSKFIVYKEPGTTGQIQWNDPNWTSFTGFECNDWDGSAETIEVPVTEEMLKCINGEVQDGWGNTAIILQGDGLTVTKIVVVP